VQINRIDQFTKGWFVGNFSPVIVPSEEFEIAVKWFKAGEIEPLHKQKIATEITVVVEGQIRLGGELFSAGDIITIPPGEYAEFESITDSSLVCVKTPSLPNDKVVGLK
jgi:quercetin dioxygenase-like cupin family protein